jgi:D-alanyl-D-alanine carboxypeptidase/D-alanyl-D-alanine-endopeptidase (penicillin-binding protein 4)
MKRALMVLLVVSSWPAWAGTSKPNKGHTVAKAKPVPRSVAKPVPRSVAKPVHRKPQCKILAKPAPAPKPAPANEVAKPPVDDPDRERVVHLQDALDEILHGKVLGRLRVGMRVEALSSGRALYGWRSGTLMDPASNQKLLATATALLRLGPAYRFRTEVTGPALDDAGNIPGDIVVRGSGDPSLRLRHIEALAHDLAQRGVTKIAGAVLADTRRIGSDEASNEGRPPLRVGATDVEVHVRPGKVGGRPVVSCRPTLDAFIVVNQAETVAKGRSRIGAQIQRAGGQYHIVVTGRISASRGEAVLHRVPPQPALYAAVLLRQALLQAGVDVRGGAGTYVEDRRFRVANAPLSGTLVALAAPSSDSLPPLKQDDPRAAKELLALHESDPLPILLRRVNKSSDNEWAERVLEAAGAEVLGGPATTGKGVRVLREALGELGVSSTAYLPSNGSGLGHQNRVTAAGMVTLLRRLYYDPRIGPDILQSLSVGGVDGTTRNRFRGSAAAHRVRAKTGTLNGVSCLSGYVGDGQEILAFSILVEGHRRRAVRSIRAAQVSAVNAMMRFAQNGAAAPSDDVTVPDVDYETGEEADEEEGPPSLPPANSDGAHSIPNVSKPNPSQSSPTPVDDGSHK